MKVRTFMTLLVILGVVIGLSGVTYAQVHTDIDTVSVSNVAGASGKHLINITVACSTYSQPDSMFILFPPGTKILSNTSGNAYAHVDTVDGDSIKIDGKSFDATLGDIVVGDTVIHPESAAYYTTIQNKTFLLDSLISSDAFNASAYTTRPMIILDFDTTKGIISGTSFEFRAHLNVNKNDTTLTSDLPDTSYNTANGSSLLNGYIDTIFVITAFRKPDLIGGAAPDVISWAKIDTVLSHIMPGALSSITRTQDFRGYSTTKKDTAGMGIGWTNYGEPTGDPYATDSLIATLKDTYGNILLDSTSVVGLKAYNTSFTIQNPGNGKLLRLTTETGGYDNATQQDTILTTTNLTRGSGGDSVGHFLFDGDYISYSKATYVSFQIFSGSVTNTSGANTLQFVNHRPKLLSLTTSTFTASVSDSFGNVCANDSLALSSHFGTGTIYIGTNSSSVNTSIGPSGGAGLDVSGKAYFRMIVGTDATEGETTKDSLIVQVLQLQAPITSPKVTSMTWGGTNLRKPIAVDIIAGEVASVSIYPTASILTDLTSTDYHDGTYNDQGRVRAGETVIFVAEITDQFGNAKTVTSSYATDSLTWSVNSGPSGGGTFASEGVSSTIGSFSLAVDTILYTTNTTVDSDTVKVTAYLPSGGTSVATRAFYTKGNVPATFKWEVSSGKVLTSATDTVRVDSVLTVKTYIWDAYGNPADTAVRAIIGVGSQSVIGSGNASNDGIGRTGTHTLSGASSLDTLIHTDFTTNPDTTYAVAYFNSDSAKGYTYVYVKTGGTKKDSIKIIKHPENTYSLDLKLVQDDGTEVDNDSSAGAIVSGSKRSFYVRLYDLHGNLVVPDTSSVRDSTIHTGSLFRGYDFWVNPTTLDESVISVDTLIKSNPKGGDSSKVAFIGSTAGDWGVVYSGSYSVLNSEGYVKYTLRTAGGRADLGKVYAEFVSDHKGKSGVIADTAYFRTTLPEAFHHFAVFVKAPSAFNAGTETSYDIGTNYTINLSPKDVGGNPIYALGVTKLELHLLDSDGNALTFDTTKTAPTAPIQAIYWTETSQLNMMDSVSGIIWTGAWSSTDSMLGSGDSSLSINVKSTKVLTGAKLRVIANTEEITTEYDSTYDLSLSWDAGAVDTIEVAPVSATTLYEQTTFDLGIRFRDAYKNSLADSQYTVQVRTNHSNVSGLDNNFVVKEYQTARVTLNKLDSPTGMQFFATIIDNPLNGHTFNPGIYGYSSMYTVSTATLNAPSSLNATDVSGDAGGYVKLSWTASANHPGMTGTTDDDLPITYYQIYRSTTNNIASASNWAYIPATPLTSSSNTTIAAEVSTNGQTGAAYYWVAACNGDLPIATTSSASATASKVYYNKDSKAATISANYAVMGANGALISAVSNSNMATATSDAQASVYGVSEEYDPVFDFNSNSDVDLSDLSTILANYGKTVGKASVAPKMGTSKINTKVNSNGDVFDLSVDFEGEESINAYGFVVSYNPAHYEFVDATKGALLSDGFFLTNDSKPGRLVVINMMRDGSEMAQGNAANLRFQWIGEEVSSLTIENISTMNDGSEIFGVESKVIESPVAIPKEFALKQNYPNPFNPTTTIKFEMPKSSNVKLEIYNILGQKVKTLVNEDMKAGYHKVTWDGTNDYSVKVSSGMYIYIIKAGDFIARHKMVLLK